jgi:enamine deaminase RidA (YjgF/YER057c/UK114 family)
MAAFPTFDPAAGREYPAFALYPFLHRSGPMPWAAASVVDMSRVDKLIFLSGATGRDPETDRRPSSFAEERAGVGTVVGPGVTEQTRACWERIKETLEGLGARLEDTIFIRYYLADRDDHWDMLEETYAFWREHAPDMAEHPRAGTLLRDVGLALRAMRIEIEVVAATAKS